MPIIFLLSFSALAATTSLSDQVYTHLDKPFLLERRLKSKIVNVGVANKLIDLNNAGDVSKLDIKIEKPLQNLKKEFGKELEKNFTQDELVYLNKVFSHVLLTRLMKFQDDFIASKSHEGQIKEALKGSTAPAASK